MEYLYLAISWISYYTLHSFLATDFLKIRMQNILGNLSRWRIAYSIISTIGILGLFYHMATINEQLLWLENSVIRVLSMIFTTYGLIVIRIAFSKNNIIDFLSKDDRFEKNTHLNEEGIYSKVRHPLYSGTLLVFLGLFLFIPKISTLLALVITIAYLFIGIRLEEKKLILMFGDKYTSYKKRVPSIVPKLF